MIIYYREKVVRQLYVFLILCLSWLVIGELFALDIGKIKKDISKFQDNGLLFYSKIYFGEKFLKAYVISRQSHDHLVVFSEDNKKLIEFSSSTIWNGFRSIHSLSLKDGKTSVLVTIWSSGSHGSMIRIFDPFQKKAASIPLYQETSSWDIRYELKGEYIEIHKRGDLLENGFPKQEIIRWPLK